MNSQNQGYWEPPRKRCCCARRGTQLMLVGLLSTAMWAGLLALLLLWHWETEKNLKQLGDTAIQNVVQMSQNLQELQAEQKQMKAQDSRLSQNLTGLQEDLRNAQSQNSKLSQNLNRLQDDLVNIKSLGLNEKRTASDSLEKLQEEVAKLWIEILISKGTACNICPKNWLHFQQKCYYFGKGSKQWIQARFACSDLQGRLVSIHSQKEQDFLMQHINKKDSWIGLQDLNMEGEFVWSDGSPVGYSNWNPGEPNNGGQGEDCVMMRGSGQWNDAFCRSYLDAWVCEQLATCEISAPLASVTPTRPTPKSEP
ncbi:low affinity immunoglobulin epsilon Fc receptor isoform E [Mus musculus]|uniref:Fc epsilon receptor II subtype b variant b delta 5 n=1 Tax=Mus musculus TaxID=10090 RepID=Q8VH33_MOUSE|nr:low affinity immunoglobulin epsilon Fc receptor isoform E [Mus musculus]AAL58516.1 Fc epsilon receptor II subtype b variant b delta 5 [Mus musculus]EDL21951.1 Fc receptor, IgE, low affinity II, alpha polypeptide, isoform CRA_d [Mus musculus]|eukprot:NP_001240674.1 low affinity immunoglobulin epsilon Fc receptor isoform E [Mus musculus]